MREVSLAFMQAVFARETGMGAIILLTIDHPSLADPIRVAGWDVDVTSRGNLFVAYPFKLTFATDEEGGTPRAKLAIDNVSREIVVAVRNAQGEAPSVLVELVTSSDPDTVEASLRGFKITNVAYNVFTVEGELGLDAFLHEPFPGGRFTPSAFPGVHL